MLSIQGSRTSTGPPGDAKSKAAESDQNDIPPSSLGEKAHSVTSESERNSPYNKDFVPKVLDPRSIRIESAGLPMKAHAHFELDEPTMTDTSSKTRSQHYTGDRGVASSSVWVEIDEPLLTSITENYKRMKKRVMCEAEFASHAKETLLKRDHFLLNAKEDRLWRTERMVELVAIPERASLWEPPPLVQEPTSAVDVQSSDYDFDLRPDCWYWLTNQAFNSEYWSIVESLTFVLYQEILCPYFTIGFKKDDLSEQRAVNQAAAAGAVALYNRYRLRHQRLQMQGNPWTQKLTKIIRHYCLTLRGCHYTVWCMKPLLSSNYEWSGCEMTPIGRGHCDQIPDVRNLIHWINEIHCWGLTQHGPRREKDVKYALETQKQKTGFRPSNVQRDSEDELDSEDDSGETPHASSTRFA